MDHTTTTAGLYIGTDSSLLLTKGAHYTRTLTIDISTTNIEYTDQNHTTKSHHQYIAVCTINFSADHSAMYIQFKTSLLLPFPLRVATKVLLSLPTWEAVKAPAGHRFKPHTQVPLSWPGFTIWVESWSTNRMLIYELLPGKRCGPEQP